VSALGRRRRPWHEAIWPCLLAVAAGASLPVLIATSALWVRGHWILNSAESQSVVPLGSGRYRYSEAAIAFGSDYLVLTRQLEEGTAVQPYGPIPAGWIWSRDPPPDHVRPPTWRDRWFGWLMWFSFSYGHSAPHPADGEYFYNFQAVIPYWSIVLASALLPGWWAVRHLRRRRRRPGAPPVCSRCGYDLRGGHDRCPECGEPTPSADEPKRSGVAAKGVAVTQSPNARSP